jgi:hypothetical protein
LIFGLFRPFPEKGSPLGLASTGKKAFVPNSSNQVRLTAADSWILQHQLEPENAKRKGVSQ